MDRRETGTAPSPVRAVCLGRAGLDLYACERDVPFAEARTFEKHVGGSPANIAFGLARLGIRTGFVGRVSDDMIGHWVRDALAAEGIDVAGLTLERGGTRTSLALTEMRPRDCGVVIHRHAAADLALCVDDLDPGTLARCELLVLSGTALAAEPSRSAALEAARLARAGGARVVLDLDYRAYTWASPEEARRVYGEAVRTAQVVLGNTEEIDVLRPASIEPGDDAALVAALHAGGVELVCLKAGPDGSTLWAAGDAPLRQPAFRVDALKPFGAGDAYAAALCAGLLDGLPLAACAERAAAAAAIVVARTSCGDASPTSAELERFIAAARSDAGDGAGDGVDDDPGGGVREDPERPPRPPETERA